MTADTRNSGVRRLCIGAVLIALGQGLLVRHQRPGSDFYFPFVWYGYILVLDGILCRMGRPSLLQQRRLAAVMIPLSAIFWWVFEAFDLVVRNWYYTGGREFTGVTYALYASLCFSTVLPAIWSTALLIDSVTPQSAWSGRAGSLRLRSAGGILAALVSSPDRDTSQEAAGRESRLMRFSMGFGVLCVVLPLLFPRIAFGLIWGSLFFLIEPLNYRLGRPSLLAAASRGRFRTAMIFAFAGLVCGFFWEYWNNWSTVGWIYIVPHIPHWRLFRMPVFGYAGYIPFGLEAYATAVLLVPPLLALVPGRSRAESARPISVSEVAS